VFRLVLRGLPGALRGRRLNWPGKLVLMQQPAVHGQMQSRAGAPIWRARASGLVLSLSLSLASRLPLAGRLPIAFTILFAGACGGGAEATTDGGRNGLLELESPVSGGHDAGVDALGCENPDLGTRLRRCEWNPQTRQFDKNCAIVCDFRD